MPRLQFALSLSLIPMLCSLASHSTVYSWQLHNQITTKLVFSVASSNAIRLDKPVAYSDYIALNANTKLYIFSAFEVIRNDWPYRRPRGVLSFCIKIACMISRCIYRNESVFSWPKIFPSLPTDDERSCTLRETLNVAY